MIVIIGLIIAGITAGSSLTRQAQLRAIGSDINSYRSAVNSFKLQYNALPGDMANAMSFWGAGTANGNGNRTVEWSAEAYLTWQHLTLSGILPGSYTGVATATYADPGVNIPKGPISNSGYNMTGHATWTGGATPPYFQIMVGKKHAGTWADNSLLTTSEVYGIDIKIDDGIAGTGIVNAYEGSEYTGSANCATPYAGITRQYILTNTNRACIIIFKM